MPSADKRKRKKENAQMAREAREAAAKRKKRLRTARNAGIAAVVFVGLILVFNLISDNGKKSTSSTSTTTTPSSTTPTPTTLKAGTYPAGCVSTKPPTPTSKTYPTAPPMTIDVKKTYVAHVKTNCGDFDITLAAAEAPQTANNFVFLANQHFYDGLKFHRLVSDFVIQGGDPKGDGSGGPGYKIPDEPPKAGYHQGSVAMANAGSGTTGSQFFVVVSQTGASGLGGPPYKYSALGDVTKGFDVVQKMMKLAGSGDGPPQSPLYMNSVTITES